MINNSHDRCFPDLLSHPESIPSIRHNHLPDDRHPTRSLPLRPPSYRSSSLPYRSRRPPTAPAAAVSITTTHCSEASHGTAGCSLHRAVGGSATPYPGPLSREHSDSSGTYTRGWNCVRRSQHALYTEVFAHGSCMFSLNERKPLGLL